jgi:hypothetical protein
MAVVRAARRGVLPAAPRHSARDCRCSRPSAGRNADTTHALDPIRRVVQLPHGSDEPRARLAGGRRAHIPRWDDGSEPPDRVVPRLRRRARVVYGDGPRLRARRFAAGDNEPWLR